MNHWGRSRLFLTSFLLPQNWLFARNQSRWQSPSARRALSFSRMKHPSIIRNISAWFGNYLIRMRMCNQGSEPSAQRGPPKSRRPVSSKPLSRKNRIIKNEESILFFLPIPSTFITVTAARHWPVWKLMSKSGYGPIYASGTRSESEKRDTSCFPSGHCTKSVSCTKCRRQRVGRRRMPCGEEHRKAVCGKTACTVWWGRAGSHLLSTLPFYFTCS